MAKILFIQHFFWEYYGIESLSSMIKENGNHEAQLLIICSVDNSALDKEIETFHPDVVGLSIMSFDLHWSRKITKYIQSRHNIPVIIGGSHAVFYPDSIKYEPFDMIMAGEGEYAIIDLLNNIENGLKGIKKIPNLYVKIDGKLYKNKARPLIEDINILPMPDKSIYFKRYPELQSITVKRVMLSRGCPYNCSFCLNGRYKDIYGVHNKIRRRSPQIAISEIKYIIKHYQPVRTIAFSDDVFTTDIKWLSEFLGLYQREIKLPFSCQVRANEIDEKITYMLGESGCHSAVLGIETGDEEFRKKVLAKHITNEMIKKTIFLLKKQGILTFSNNMIGLPGETLELAMKTVELNAHLPVDYASCGIFQPLRGSVLDAEVRKSDLLKSEYDFQPDFSQFGCSPLKLPHEDKIANIMGFFYIVTKYPVLLPLFKKCLSIKLGSIPRFLTIWSNMIREKKRQNMTLSDIFKVAKLNRKAAGY